MSSQEKIKKGALLIATTHLKPLHTGTNRSLRTALRSILGYMENPEKTEQGKLVTCYQCSAEIAAAEFLFSKQRYAAKSGKSPGNVIAYHLRQSFKPGEITPEEANRLGVELARRFTKGNHAFVVCTHTDKAHIHNHIVWNSVSLDCTRKFQNFHGSARAVQRLSDAICLENGLSIVAEPKRKGKRYDQWLKSSKQPAERVNLLVDIQAKLQQGKGPGYVRWATSFNLKQMEKTMWYLSEHKLYDYAQLSAKTDAATAQYHILSQQIKAAEQRMAEIKALKTHIINYSKTRSVYVAYRKSGYSQKFRQTHETEILLHQAAKKAFDALDAKPLPTIKGLNSEYAALLAQKRAVYAQYRTSRAEMRELLAIKANVDLLLNKASPTPAAQRKEEQERH